jgi:hypothetical protein
MRKGVCPPAFALALSLVTASPVAAEVAVQGRGILFYTDDVGIFSATRRLSRDGDPTQPALDSRLTDKGSDIVLEPDLTLSTSRENRFWTLELSAKGQGFIYTDHARFNHGTLRLQALQAFSTDTRAASVLLCAQPVPGRQRKQAAGSDRADQGIRLQLHLVRATGTYADPEPGSAGVDPVRPAPL